MKGFIKLTDISRGKVLVNINNIASVEVEGGERTVVYFNSCTSDDMIRNYVKETFEEVCRKIEEAV